MMNRFGVVVNAARRLLLNAGAAGPSMEGLEVREVLAAVSWDGGAGTANWHDALNWSNDAIPVAADDVTIPSTALSEIAFTATTGSRTIRSLSSQEAINFSGGTLTVATTATTDSPITLSGGSLSGGTYTLTNGAAMTVAGAGGGTLNNLTIGGEIRIPVGAVTLAGTTSFAAARLLGGSTTLRVAPGATFNGEVVAEGAATGTRTVQFAFGGSGTGTIGASGVIRLDASSGGPLTITDSSNATLVNNGLILAGGTQTLTISPNILTNNGTLRMMGGTVNVSPQASYTNPGTIDVEGGTLNLGSTWNATAGIGTWDRTGGTVNVTGVLTNTGSTIALNASTGSWNLAGGNINGGSMTVADGASLVLTASQGTLTNLNYGADLTLPAGAFVTLAGSVTFPTMHMTGTSTLRVAPGGTINGQVVAEGAATGTRTVQFAFGGSGTGTIGASGAIRLDATSGGPLSITESSNATLVNNGLIVAGGTQTLTISTNVLTNNGTLRVTSGTMNVAPQTSYTSTGTIDVEGGTLNLGSTWNATAGIGTWDRTGGTVNVTGVVTNTGSTIALNASTGSWNLAGGNINGGSMTVADGSSLLLTASPGTLTNLNYGADLTLPAGAFVTLAGSVTFPTMHMTGTSTLRVAPGGTINGQVVAEGAATGTRTVQFAFGGSGTGTIGVSGAIRLDATSGGPLSINESSNATLVNNGLIQAGGTQALTIAPNVLTNNGTLRVTSGTMNVSPQTSYTNPGTIDVEGGTLNLGSTWNATAGIGTWDRTGGTVNVTGVVTNTGSTIALNASTGSWNLAGGNINGGSMTVADGASLVLTASAGTLTNLNYGADLTLPAGTFVTLSGSVTFPTIHMTGTSSLRIGPGGTINGEVVAEGAATGTRTVQFAFGGNGTGEIGATGVIRLDPTSGGPLNIAESSNATVTNHGLILAGGTQTLTVSANTLVNNGTLRVTGGTLNMSLQNTWTNAGTVDIDGGTLNLVTTFNAASGIGTWDRTGGTVNVTGVITNTGSTIALNASTGSWNLAGGNINGGSMTVAGGASLVLTSAGGTLSNVTYGADLTLGTGTAVTFAGVVTFPTVHMTGTSSLRIGPGGTINGEVVAEGAATGTRTVQFAFGGNGTGAIGATGVIRLDPTSGGPLNIAESSNATVTNHGLILAGGTQTLSVSANTLVNNGTLRVTGGALNMSLQNTWTNAGTVDIEGGTLNLVTAFNATAGIGAWDRTGGTVNVTGTITNTGSTIALDTNTGSWNLTGGNVNGGTMTVADGASLVLTASGGTLTNLNYGADMTLGTGTSVTFAGIVTFPTVHMTGASNLRIVPGGTINGEVVAEGAATGTRTVQFAFGGNGTGAIGATGVIRLDPTSGGPLNIAESSNATVTNHGLILAGGTQTLTVSANTLVNNGTLRVTGGALNMSLQNTWTNAGTVDVEGGTLNLVTAFNATSGIGTWDRTGGTVNVTGTITNTGSTIALNASTGSWNLSGGNISGGSLSVGSGSELVITPSGGVLSNLTVANDITVPANASVQVSGTTRFGTAHLAGPNATLRFSPGYTLHDDVVAEGAAPGTRFATAAFGGNGSLTISSTGSVRLAPGTGGNLNFGESSNATVTNNGLIAAEAAGRTLSISVNALTNLAAGTLSGGEWVATNSAALNLGTGRNVTTNAATIRIDGAASSVSGLTSLASNTGSLTLAGGRDLSVPGFSNSGTLNLGPASQLTVTGAFTQTTTGTLNLVLGGNAAADLARVVASGNANLAGAWTVGGVTEFPPAYGEIFDLVAGAARFGNFASFTSGFVPAGVFVELYSGTAARAAFDRRAGVWTGAGDGTTWSDPANWFNNTLPTAADTAYIGLPASSPTIHVTSGTQTVGSVVSTEAIVIDAGATLSLVGDVQARFDAELTNSGVLDSDTGVLAGGGGVQTGQFVMANGTTLSLAGSHAFAGGSSILGAATVAVLGGDSTFAGSVASTVSLHTSAGAAATLTQNYAFAGIENAGSLDIASRMITVAGAFNQAESGVLGVDLVSESVVGSINAATSSLAGAISLSNSGGFDPSNPMIPLYGISIVNAQSVTGSALVTTQPTLTVGSFVARVQGNALRLLHNVADFNGDRGVDADDVIAYFAAWDNGELIADLNGDGGVDSDDVIFFFGFWDIGGR